MSTQENLNKEKQSSNGWQNVGICFDFARAKVPVKLQLMYMNIARDSFGYLKKRTSRMSQTEMSKRYGLTRQTISEQIKKLEALGLIKVIGQNNFIEGGGSEACAYALDFPRGFGHLKWTEDSEPEVNSKLDAIRKKDEEQRNDKCF